MRNILIAAAMACGFLVGTGCNKSEEGGQTGVRGGGFHLTMPTTNTHLKPKASKDVTIDVVRESNMNEAVTVSAVDVPKGLAVNPMSKTADAAAKQVTFTVTADENAQPGSYIVKMSAKPQTGKDVVGDLKVEVDKP